MWQASSMTDPTEPDDQTPGSAKNRVREAILATIDEAKDGRTVSPEDVARTVSDKNWNKVIPHVKAEAVRMAKAGEIAIYRKGKPVDPDNFKGVWRVGRPE